MRLAYALKHPGCRSVRRFVRRFGSYKKLIAILVTLNSNPHFMYSGCYERGIIRVLIYRKIPNTFHCLPKLLKHNLHRDAVLLLSAGVSIYDSRVKLAFIISFNKENSLRTLRCIIAMTDDATQKEIEKSPFLLNDVITAKIFIEAGTPVNGTSKNIPSPLHYAAQRFNYDLVQVLLEHGARADKLFYKTDVDLDKLFTPLQYAKREILRRIAIWRYNNINRTVSLYTLSKHEIAFQSVRMLLLRAERTAV